MTGNRAFVPKPSPPDPSLRWDADLLRALSEADLALGRLDGLARSLPNLDLFVAMYVRREAVLSSQTVKYAVEQVGGTPTTIGGLLDKPVTMRIIEETTGHKRNRIYRCAPFLDLFTSEDRFGLIGATQADAWERVEQLHGGLPGAQSKFVARL